ncbi:MAG: hypothetical protein AVDCRST_MAG44-1328, partial [uncultured Sphingomonas sp.]
ACLALDPVCYRFGHGVRWPCSDVVRPGAARQFSRCVRAGARGRVHRLFDQRRCQPADRNL